MQTSFPADFILSVEYGVDRNGNKADDSTNISGAFEYLAPLLDSQLRTYVENPSSLWHQAWAFTRYNVVGHSQGGVLLRMLCTSENPEPSNPHPSFKPFRSDNNAYRGRFHRGITLNSPHNGSTILRYLLDLKNEGFGIVGLIEAKAGPIIQEKFDPFGAEMREINIDHWQVDPTAKFHMIGTTINSGYAPSVGELFPLCYSLSGLAGQVLGQTYSRGSIVLPLGSDGVVDFASEFAGLAPNPMTTIVEGVNISHSGPALIFGVGVDDTATSSALVGERVTDLLNGPVCVNGLCAFGSFDSQPVDANLRAQIDAVVPACFERDVITPSASLSKGPRLSRMASTTYQFAISPPADSQPATAPAWHVEIFGPDGISFDGVTAIPNSNDPNSVSVSVDDSVVGDVMLYVSYNDTNGRLVVGTPAIVVSRPAGSTLTGIELIPNSISLVTGSRINSEVWADYDNGMRSRLHIPTGAVVNYSSDDDAVASVDSTGEVILKAIGTTTIHVSYLGFSAQSAVSVSAAPPPPVIVPLGAVSRKIHGEIGTFDIDLPLTGNPGIECRSGGASNAYQVIVTFASPVTLSNVTIAPSTGSTPTMNASVTGYSIDGSQVLINISDLPNAQTSVITLSNVSDGGAPNDVVIPISLLIGDTTGNGTVNSSDVSLTKLKSGQAIDASNFRNDVGANGSINSSDVSQVKLQSGTALP